MRIKQQKEKAGLVSLAIWVCAFLAVCFFIGMMSKNSIDSWYDTLQRSSLTPPKIYFSWIWSILYAMIATSGWMIWREVGPGVMSVKMLFTAQTLLNWIWSPLFFGYHRTGWALVSLVACLALVVTLIIHVWKKIPLAALLLLPYAAWLAFAGYLNVYVWIRN